MATEKYPDEKGALFSFAGNSGTLAFSLLINYFSEAKGK
jgi:hypothetical protein